MTASRLANRAGLPAVFGNLDRVIDGLLWLRARRLFQRCGLFAGLPLTGRVLEVEGNYGHLAEAAVHHIPNRQCVVVDSDRQRRPRVDRRVRRRKFHRVCAPPDRLPFATASFDAAWIAFALARLAPAAQETVLAEMVRVVRPGGVLVALEWVVGRVPQRLQARLGEALALSAPFGARAYRPAEEWRSVLSRQGWRIDSEQVVNDRFGLIACRSFVCRRLPLP